ncbi:MAG TPA: glycosyltransferase family 9 protein [Pseudonocardiaceae bacterium]|nr:glycosyltransferase family 9 protein [Pseudonocardiaceae bacterium]
MTRAGIGPVLEPFPGVRRIAVVRGGGLGDLLFALPAIESLAAAYPEAEIVLIGSPLHRELLDGRPGPVGSVLTLPADTSDPDSGGAEAAEIAGRAGPFDLGLQLHGGGRWSNGFVRRLGVRWSVGCRTADAAPLTRSVPFRYYQHETLRALEVVGLAGAPPVALVPRLAVTRDDLSGAADALAGLPEPVLAVHPGATDPRRRWPAARFGETIAAAVERAGGAAAVVGTAEEGGLVAEVVGAARDRLPAARRAAVRPLAGRLTPGGLAGVLAGCRVLLANDSGPRHLAEAVGSPTVSVYWVGNVINAGPLGRSRHRVHISWTCRCPVCGVDCTDETAPRCAHDESFVAGVPIEPVLADVVELSRRRRS